jgi:hypothetical protein
VPQREEAAVRVVIRIVLVEFSLAWVMVLAGWFRAGLKAVPFFAGTVAVTWQRVNWQRVNWRPLLALVIGTPILAGWPLLFILMQSERGYHLWMRGIAIPWWIILACGGAVFLAARAEMTGPDT